jgi:integrase
LSWFGTESGTAPDLVPWWYRDDKLTFARDEKCPARTSIATNEDTGDALMPAPNPTATILLREERGKPFYEAKFRCDGRQIKRRIGPAWLERDPDTGGWRKHRGRVPDDAYDERGAHVAAAKLIAEYVSNAADHERLEQERRSRGVTFREVAAAYLAWLEKVKGAKSSTLLSHRCVLAEPGTAYKRGKGTTHGPVLAALGDRPAAKITTREVEALLETIDATGASPRTVNKYRAVVCAVFNYGRRESTFDLPTNPAAGADKRQEPSRGVLDFYSPSEIEALARALENGLHRDAARPAATDEDRRDAELVRVASYAGLRLGELLALRWRDVSFAGHAITVARALSAGVESSTKSRQARQVPLADQAAGALDRLSRRDDFTTADDLVFTNVLGRFIDDSALRRRFKQARDATGLRPLRFHDLRHTFGSLLASRGVDLVTIQSAMGHSQLATTSIYLHARPASEHAQAFTAAFAEDAAEDLAVAA